MYWKKGKMNCHKPKNVIVSQSTQCIWGKKVQSDKEVKTASLPLPPSKPKVISLGKNLSLGAV